MFLLRLNFNGSRRLAVGSRALSPFGRRAIRACVPALILSLVVLSANCRKSNVREAIPTGVEVIELEDGRTEFRSTARASQAAIDSGNFVKKQNTGCAAARLLLDNEFRDRGFGMVDYSRAEFFMIYEAEYCRAVIIR
ncbi:MAG: hypothetical protein NXI24_21950 [bacterium]|nr:hypothetical protein [bacterium]